MCHERVDELTTKQDATTDKTNCPMWHGQRRRCAAHVEHVRPRRVTGLDSAALPVLLDGRRS